MARSKAFATSEPSRRGLACKATHSLVNWSTTIRTPNLRPSSRCHGRWPFSSPGLAPAGTPRPRGGGARFSSSAWCAPEGLPLCRAGRRFSDSPSTPATAEQDGQPLQAKVHADGCQFLKPHPQSTLGILLGVVECRYPGNAGQTASPPLWQPVPSQNRVEELAADRGLQTYLDRIF